MASERRCQTRRLKEARYLQREHPGLVPSPEPSEGFDSVLDGTDPSIRFELRAALDPERLPSVLPRAVPPLFSGTIQLVRLRAPQRAGPDLRVLDASAQLLVEYLERALVPIVRYVRSYGAAEFGLVRTVDELVLPQGRGRFNDSELQAAVDRFARPMAPAARSVVALGPPGAVNTDADLSKGVLGYHAKGAVPYAYVGLPEGELTLGDSADRFALALSHVVAEMVVDPRAELGNPEVCDPCAPEGASPCRNFFDEALRHVGGGTDFPPNHPYAFFIAAIAPPSVAGTGHAPKDACAAPPPV